MGITGVAYRESQVRGPVGGVPMGQFRASPYRGLSSKGPLIKYVMPVDMPDAVIVSDGCIHSPSCFTCPLSDCHYTKEKSKLPIHTRSLRDEQLIGLSQEGHLVKRLAEQFGISKRMVYRVLQKGREALHVNSG